MDSLARYEFKKKLEELEAIKGRATELVSLYIPPSRKIADVLNYLRNEYAQSSNIKSKGTRKNVMWAIDSLIGKIKFLKDTTPNGLALFVGHKAISIDKQEAVSYVIEPLEPLQTFLYRCDSSFYLEPLKEMVAEKECYGIIVMDRKEATLGLVKGKRTEVIKNVQSRVPSKHRMGGQSALRFERLIEQAAHEFFVKIGDLATESFLDKALKGIIVGGPGYTKNFFLEKDYLHHELKKKVIGAFETGYTDEYGLREVIESASETLKNMSLIKEKKLVQEFMSEIIKEGGLASYGEEEVISRLKRGEVAMLLVSEKLKRQKLKLKCSSCGNEEESSFEEPPKFFKCSKCNAESTILESRDL
ncbi:MAG: peptide chain release factor aRF-1, partial [Candidatus Thermoplasmatota archaeon]|nr:peptide chain release factor aRF-1 [Candidatus Thermoplasmatota archaeon]